MDFLQNTYWNNTGQQWTIALGIAVGIFVVYRIIKSVILIRLEKIAQRTTTKTDDAVIAVIKRTNSILVMLIAIAFGAQALTLPEKISGIIPTVVTIAFALQLALWLNTLVSEALTRLQEAKKEKDPAGASAFGALSFFARLLVWSLVGFLILDNFGVDITALVAGLGIGGIAVALAVQNVLSDIFNSVAILIDKPFEVGDFIVVGDMMGAVERIGIRTSRVRSLSGELLVFSNSDLVNSRIKNYKTMAERRVVFEIGVTYQTPVEKLEKIPGMIREIIESIDNTRFDRSHFKAHGDFALLFETVYYVLSGDYNQNMDIKQQINLAIHSKFAIENIEFAYPTQTMIVEGGATDISPT